MLLAAQRVIRSDSYSRELVANGLFARAPKQGAVPIADNAKNPFSGADASSMISRIQASFQSQFGGAITIRVDKVRDVVILDLLPTLRASAAHVTYDGAAHIGKTVFRQVAFGLTAAGTIDRDMLRVALGR